MFKLFPIEKKYPREESSVINTLVGWLLVVGFMADCLTRDLGL